MHILMEELERRWGKLFADLAAGLDAPPSLRLRAEGLMEAVVLAGSASPEEVQAAMDRCYEAAFGTTLAADFGDDWAAFFPFPQIPAMARRAPVFPSTRDED